MLEKDFWLPWQPRVQFPVFANYENVYDLVVQDSLNGSGLKSILMPLYHAFKKQKSFLFAIRNYWWILTNKKIEFKYSYLDRNGNLIKTWQDLKTYGRGDVFSLNLNQILSRDGIPLNDGQILFVATRGRLDRWNSSPGSMTARFIGQGKISGYRTGFFARPLNASSKGHFGFTGLNPKIRCDERFNSSLMYINHSSNPQYTEVANPEVFLYKSPDQYLKAQFGEIPPLGCLEKRITDLFPEAQEFLKETNGFGYTVTKIKGISLASIHITRDIEGKLLGIEHSRPSHAAVIRYAENKNYTKKKKTA